MKFERNVVLYEDDIIVLHGFLKGSLGRPVLVIPPHAGRHGNITQNLIDSLSNLRQTYAIELKPALPDNERVDVSRLVEKIAGCVKIIKQQNDFRTIDLAGACMGGWLSTIYTSLYQENINRLALFASPINTKTGKKNSIEDYCKIINLDFHRMIVKMNNGIQPGYMQWCAFAISNPIPVFLGRYVDLYNHIADGDLPKVKRWIKNNAWYDQPIDLDGTWFLEALEKHFVNNELYDGTWEICGKKVTLANITCPVFVYTGKNDEITHSEQGRAILDKVSSTEKHYTDFPDAGHTAVFVRGSCIDKFIDDFYVREIL